MENLNSVSQDVCGYQRTHVDQFLSVPGAYVTVQTKENDTVTVEEFLAIVGRIAASQPKAKIRYWVRIEN